MGTQTADLAFLVQFCRLTKMRRHQVGSVKVPGGTLGRFIGRAGSS